MDHRGLMSGEEQEHGHGGGLLVGYAVGRAQPRDHVVAGVSALARNQSAAVFEQVGQPALGAGVIAHVAGIVCPAAELGSVGIGHAE